MPSGGARTRSGPAPDPNALRRDRPGDRDGWTTLPADGRTGPAPEWPLTTQTERERELWTSHWRKPQAVIWERDHIIENVAMYVRQFCEGEVPKSSAENRKTTRMMAADLYLTPDSLLKAKLRIGQVATTLASVTPIRASARSRLTVTDGSGA